MPIIYCYINPFVMEQNIYEANSMDGTLVFKEKVPLENLPEYFVARADGENRFVIHSDSDELSQGYAEKIKTYALTNYGLNNFEIEVN